MAAMCIVQLLEIVIHRFKEREMFAFVHVLSSPISESSQPTSYNTNFCSSSSNRDIAHPTTIQIHNVTGSNGRLQQFASNCIQLTLISIKLWTCLNSNEDHLIKCRPVVCKCRCCTSCHNFSTISDVLLRIHAIFPDVKALVMVKDLKVVEWFWAILVEINWSVI